jgi:hypothetical protein
MRKYILLQILIISFVFILTSVIHSAEEVKERLLVIPLKAKVGIVQEEVSILRDILYTEIIKLKMLTVLNRDDMKAILDKNEFELAMGCNDNVCLLENVAKLSVSKVIVGSIGALGKRYILVLKLINKEGQTELMEKEICDCPIEELTKSIEILSHKFIKYLREQVEVKKDGLVDLNKTVNVNSDKELEQTVIFEKLDGAMIVGIKDLSPAKDAGFEKGDIVIAYDNKKITNYNELLNAVAQTEVGKKVDVNVLRKGKRETQAVVISKHKEGETKEWLGLEFINLDQYAGEWKDGMMNGQGTFTWTNGEKYVGEWKDNKKHGQGTHISSDGTKHVGEWKDNKKRGQGVTTWSNGTKWAGEWKDDMRNGQGTITWANGEKYVGEWKDDKKHGQGTHTSPDGTKYEGEWKDNLRNGQGTITWSNGTKYVGECKDDMMNGQGTITWANGEKYVGEWKDNKKHGQGIHTSPDGTKYVGEWKDNMRNGQGTITWIKGEKYEGEWKDNMRNGQGTMTWIKGEKYEGEWKDNIAVGGWYYWPSNRKRKWAYNDSQGNFHFERKKSWWNKH